MILADTATFSAALKTQFIGPIRDELWKGKVLLFGGDDSNPEGFQGIKRSAEGVNFVGNEFRIPIKTKRNQAVGFRFENETLPAASSSEYTYIQDQMRYAYGALTITGQLLEASVKNEGAFRSAFKAEMEDPTESSRLDHNRAAWGDSTGKLANVASNATSGATTVTLDTTVSFRGGEIIDFTTSAGTVVSAAHEVTGVDRVNKRITVAPALAANVTARTHFPVRASVSSTTSVPNNSLNREINGLENIISDSGTLHGINPNNYGEWKSYVRTGVGGLTETVLRNAKDGVGFESGVDLDSSDFIWITTRGARSRYADTLIAYRRFTEANGTKLNGGFRALEFDGDYIFTDDHCKPGNVYGIHMRKLMWIEGTDWEWMDRDGNVLSKIPGKDAYQATLYKYMNLGTTSRKSHLRLSGVTDDDR